MKLFKKKNKKPEPIKTTGIFIREDGTSYIVANRNEKIQRKLDMMHEAYLRENSKEKMQKVVEYDDDLPF